MIQKPKCVTLLPWLKSNLGNRSLAPLTGTDARALAAAVQIVELYAYDPNPSLMEAFGKVVARMQQHTRHLAFHSIAHVLEWSDRAKLWAMAGLELIPVPRCAHEPRRES